MKALLQRKNQPSPAVLEELFKGRQEVLKQIEAREITLGPHSNELGAQELRHRLLDRNYHGEFLPMVCDHCYTDLWQAREDKIVSCPGCGWVP